MRPLRVLIVDDSATSRAALRLALSGESSIEVVGEAADGATALRLVRELVPDVITMDVFLRAESGLKLARSIMESRATPIVVVTSASPRDPSLLFSAMQAGVLEVCGKLPSPTHPDYPLRRARLVRTLKALGHVPVVHRTKARTREHAAAVAPPLCPQRATSTQAAGGMLLIGASTGGPPVLAQLLRALPKPFPLAIAVVQHMASGFIQGFAAWLAEQTGHPVSVLSAACVPTPGVVHLPIDDHHLLVEPGVRLVASSASPHGFYRPSVDLLFESAATTLAAAQTVGVLLTGMGNDGARGLASLRQAGAHTFVQDPGTCTVASMPRQAIALGAAERVCAPEELALSIARCAGRS